MAIGGNIKRQIGDVTAKLVLNSISSNFSAWYHTGNDEIEQKGMVPEYSGRLRTRVLIRGTLTSKIRVFSTLHI